MKKIQSYLLLLNAFPLGMASAIILCIICVMTLMPPSGVPSVSVPNIDKVVHMLFFGILSTVFIFDVSRYLKRTGIGIYLCCAFASTLIGAIIEITQDAMGLGRSGDWYDLIADAFGAFAIPLLFRKLIERLTTDYSLKLSEVKKSSRIPAAIRKLYFSSFPPDEQRPWQSIEQLIDNDKRFHFEIIRIGDADCGLVTWWKLDGFSYIEHFAVSPDMRSKGIGSLALSRFIARNRMQSVVLEVEPEATGEMARRRIGFYRRHGFSLHPEFHYVQPPYTPESSPVELMLMTSGIAPDLNHVTSALHKDVYDWKN